MDKIEIRICFMFDIVIWPIETVKFCACHKDTFKDHIHIVGYKINKNEAQSL